METAGLLGTSSAVDSQAWQEVMQQRMPPSTSRPPSILETGATCQSSAILHLHAWSVSLHGTCKSSENVPASLLLLVLRHIDQCRIGVVSHCVQWSSYYCSFTLLAVVMSVWGAASAET